MSDYMKYSTWLNRNKQQSLENYKKQQRKIAISRDKLEELNAAKTLTQARKAVYGQRTKSYSAWKGNPELVGKSQKRPR